MKKITLLTTLLVSVMLIASGAGFAQDTGAGCQDAGGENTTDQGTTAQGVGAGGTSTQDTGGEAAGQGAGTQGVSTGGTASQGTAAQGVGAEATGQGITSEGAAGGGGITGETEGIGGGGGDKGSVARETSENAYGQGKVNINTATKGELIMVPGISRSLADSIIQYRDTNGPFNNVDDLANVRGIDQDKIDDIRFYTKLEGPTDIEPDLVRSQQSTPFPEYAPDSGGSPPAE